MPRRLTAPLCLLLLALLTRSVSANDWPQYRGEGGEGKSSDSLQRVNWPEEGPTVLWKQPTPLGFSSFAVSDGKVFTFIARGNGDAGDDLSKKSQTCIAMDANSGQELWAHSMGRCDFPGGGNAGASKNRGGDGPRSTPTVDEGHVYAYDSKLKLVCLNAETGNLVWQQDIVKDFSGRNISWENATSPIIDGQMLYVAGGGPGESLLAFNKRTGEVIWKSGDELLTHAGPVLTTIHNQKQLIYFMQSGLVAVNPTDGIEIWRTEFPFNVSTAAQPVVAGNFVYCSAGYGVGAGLFRITEAMQAEDVWLKKNKLMNHWSTPVVHHDHLYGMYEFKKYGKAPLQCVELATGKIKWKQRGFGPGNCIIVDDKVVALSDAGELVIAKADPSGYQELARAKILNGKCWSAPAYSNGRIYIRSTEEGACVKLN